MLGDNSKKIFFTLTTQTLVICPKKNFISWIHFWLIFKKSLLTLVPGGRAEENFPWKYIPLKSSYSYLFGYCGMVRCARILRHVITSWDTWLELSTFFLIESSKAGIQSTVMDSCSPQSRVQFTSSDSLLCSSCLPRSSRTWTFSYTIQGFE